MASNQMKLELLLKGNDQLSKIVAKNSAALKAFKKDAESTVKTLDKLFNVSGKFKSVDKKSFDFSSQFKKSNSEADKLTQKLNEVIRLYNKAAKVSSAPSSPNQPRTTYTERPPKQRTPKEELDSAFGTGRKGKGLINRAADFNDRYIEPTKQIASTWKDGFDSLRQYTDETTRLYRVQERFKTINLSEEENKKASDAISRTVKELKGVSRTDATQTFTDIYNALRNVDSAIEALPLAAKYQRSMNALYGDVFSPEQVNRQILSAYKFAELTGKTGNRAEMEETVNALSKITNSTGGEITSANMLLAAKRGKTSMKNLSPKGLLNVAAVVDEFGGDNTGTSLMSLSQSLVGGKMEERAAARFDHFGLLDRSKIEYGKAQKIKKVLPGANKLGDALQEDPLKAADMLRDAMKAKGVDVSNPGEVDKELYILFGNRNAQALMSKYINEREQVLKEANAAANSKGVVEVDNQIFGSNSDLAKLQEYQAAWKDFRTELGMPLLKGGAELGKTVAPILKLASEYPKLTLGLFGAYKMVGLLGQSASILNASGFGSLFGRTADDAGKATKKVGGLKNALGGLGKSRTVGVVASVTSVIGLGFALDKAVQAAIDANKSQQNTTTLRKNTGDSLSEIEADYANRLIPEKVPQIIYKNRAVTALDDFNQDNQLKYAAGGGTVWEKFSNRWKAESTANLYGLGVKPALSLYNNVIPDQTEKMFGWRAPELNTLYNPFTGKHNYINNPYETLSGGFNKEKATKDFSQRTDLKSPLVMAEMLRLISERFPKEAQKPVKESLQAAHPDAFQQANQLFNQKTNEIIQSMLGLKNPIDGMQQKFLTLPQSTNQLQQSLLFLTPSTDQTKQSFDALKDPASALSLIFPSLKTHSDTASTSVGNLATQAESAAGRLGAVQFNAPNILFPSGGTSSNQGGKTAVPKLAFKDPLAGVLGRATGGGVAKGHTYQINEKGQEFFTPASSGSIVTNDYLRRMSKAREDFKREAETGKTPASARINGNSRNSEAGNTSLVSRRGGSPTVNHNTYHVTIQMQGNGVGQAEKAADAFMRRIQKLEKQMHNVQEDLQPDNVARRVVFAAARDSERT